MNVVKSNDSDPTHEFVVVELRTHGVSGTPPESMLETDSVVAIDTGKHKRFFRERNPSRSSLIVDRTEHDRVREAYHWGGMTSGGFMQALWALLLPFSLVNLAQWMLPAPTGRRTARAVTTARALIRVIGLLLTALITAQLTVILADLFFAQCLSFTVPVSGAAQCWSSESIAGHLPSWLERWTVGKALIADIPDELRDHPLWIGIVIALIVTAAVVLCGTMTGSWYAKKLGFGQDKAVDGADKVSAIATENPAPIGSNEFRAKSTGSPTASALRTLHTVAAFCTSGLMLLGMWFPSGFNVESGLFLLAASFGGSALVCSLWLDDPTLSGGRYRSGHPLARKVLGGRAGWIVSVAAFLAFLAVCVLVVPERLDSSAFGMSMTGSNDAVSALMVALCGVCVALFGIVLGPAVSQWRFHSEMVPRAGKKSRPRVPRKFKAMLFGIHAPILAALACILGSGFGAGLTQIVAHFLVQNGIKARLPGIYQAVAFLWGVIALGLVALAVVALADLAFRSLRKPYPDAKAVQFGATTPGFCQRVKFGARWYLSRINQNLHRVVAYVVFCAVLGGVISIHTSDDLPGWLLSLRDATTGRIVDPVVDFVLHWDYLANADWAARQGALEGAGFAILGLIAATLLRSIMNARKNPEKAGRNLGVIWDIASFWPREAHPVTPLSYAPTALDDLVGRIYHHLGRNPKTGDVDPTREQDNRVVLCGHSQGSLLMYAAVLQVQRELTTDPNYSGDDLNRLGLLTYGSQLQWAFVRGFPSMLSFDSHGRVMGTLEGRWHNLIRFTDFVGGPVLSWDRTLDDNQTLSAEVLVPWNGTAIYKREPAQRGAGGLVTLGREHWLADPEPGTEKMRGHSDYFASRHWDRVVARLFLEAVPPASTNDPATSSANSPEAPVGRDDDGDR